MIRLPIAPRIVRFILVGGVNTLFGLACYSLLALTSWPTWLVLVCSNVIGLLFNFMTTGGIVFRDLGPRRLPRFLLSYLAVFLIYWGLIRWLSPLVGGRIGAMMIIVIPMAAVTYLLQSRLVFRGATSTSNDGA